MGAFHYYGTWRKIVKREMLETDARETGFRKRARGKFDGPRFFWSLVLGAGAGAKRSLAGVARLAGMLTGECVSRQALHQRMAQGAVAFLQRTCLSLIRRSLACGGDPLPGCLKAFEDVDAVDSTTVRLADRLAKKFPACRSNVRKAALKIHALMSLTHKQVERLRMTAERVHDRRGGLFGQWVQDRLMLFDLGFFDYRLFGEIIRYGGAFLTRLKESANGTIVRVRRGCRKRHVGGRMNRSIYDRRIVDMDVRFGRGDAAIVLRVIGIWDTETRDFHWYVTSLSPEEFSPEEIAQAYRLRWQIELLFKTWKSICRLDQLPSGKETVVLCLVYASLCAALLARFAAWLASRRYGIPWQLLCLSTAAQIIPAYALTLGRALLRGPAARLRDVLDDLIESLGAHARVSNRTHAVLAFAKPGF